MKSIHTLTMSIITVLLIGASLWGQTPMRVMDAIPATIDYSEKLRDWDGFGFNYVELAHTYDYQEFKQEYGGFSLLDEREKQEIVQMVFGADGLKVGLVKMFLDPLHQQRPKGPFDHKTTTENMRYFVREGLKLTRQRGDDFTIITTLYGPPEWANLQKVPRGRDLVPSLKREVAQYMIDWVKYLKQEEGFPVKYLSLHNEGEDWSRWNEKGYTTWAGHDYNLYWPPDQVVDFLEFMPQMVRKAGLSDVFVTNGEPSNWYRFSTWGFVDALLKSNQALDNLKLITSHGFYGGDYGFFFGEHKSEGIDRIRERKPGLHAWVTSTSWSKMDAANIKEMHGNIYTAKVNGIIPWAGIQRPTHWVKGDPNPGSAFSVDEDGNYTVRRGYYFYKQITRAGQPGMSVVRTWQENSVLALIAFGSNGTKHPDAFVVVHLKIPDYSGKYPDRTIEIEIKGSKAKSFAAFQTTEDETKKYSPIGQFKVKDNKIRFTSSPGSVTTFFGQ